MLTHVRGEPSANRTPGNTDDESTAGGAADESADAATGADENTVIPAADDEGVVAAAVDEGVVTAAGDEGVVSTVYVPGSMLITPDNMDTQIALEMVDAAFQEEEAGLSEATTVMLGDHLLDGDEIIDDPAEDTQEI